MEIFYMRPIDSFGRQSEYDLLNKNFKNIKSSLIAIYGRRRVGKSYFLNKYSSLKHGLYFEGLEDQNTPDQIIHFKNTLFDQTKDPLLQNMVFKNWSDVFNYLNHYFKNKSDKKVIVFDEFQWMAASQSKLISLLKFYWDNHWKNMDVQLILCGSICSYMLTKVIKSKALYGRIDLQINMQPLTPAYISSILKNKLSEHEVIKYMLLFGGLPKYFELINPKNSFDRNIQNLCFEQDSFFSTEFDKIFYSQFKKHRLHEKIVGLLSKESLTLEKISKLLKMQSSGGLKRYLTELEQAGFIRGLSSKMDNNRKFIRYKICDEYLIFYFKFIQPKLKLIYAGQSKNLFTEQVKTKWIPWTGIAFENFCYRNLSHITKALDIDGKIDNFGPHIDQKIDGTQIDLLIRTTDKCLYVCECKYSDKPISSAIIKDFERKLKILKPHKSMSVKKVLITVSGITAELESSEYFDHVVSCGDYFTEVK